MKKFALRILTFLPIAAIGYVAMICLLGSMGWVRTGMMEMGDFGHLNTRAKDVRNYHDIDVLFLGSSHCYRTFDTRFYREQGINCFNLGSSNQTPMQTYVLLKQYLDSLNPKFVVFEVHPDIMKNDGVESGVNLLANVPLTKEALGMTLQLNNMKVWNTLFHSFYDQKICHKLEQFHEDTAIGAYIYVPGGYCQVDTNEFQVKRYPKTEISINPKQLSALKKCIDLFEERNIPFLLVEVQDSEQQRKAYTNHEWFEQQMQSLGDYRYKILPMVDTIHFFNSNHLDKPGIEMFNNDFVVDLKKQLRK